MIRIVAFVGLTALASAGTPPQLPTTFDGFALGDKFASTVGARSPYDRACDNDRLDREPKFRAMIYYGGNPCHHTQFPDGTSVAFMIDSADTEDAPIRAFGFIGGHYYDSRLTLPLKLGEPAARASELFGAPLAKFDTRSMHVARYANGLRVLSGRTDQITGFIFGDMPDDPAAARWEIFDLINGHTKPVPNAAMPVADCKAAVAREYQLDGIKEAPRQDDIDDCRANLTPAHVKCMRAAKTRDAMSSCFSEH